MTATLTAEPIATIGARSSFEALRRRFRGPLLRPGDEGYDEARRVWNGAIDRRPALIARCTGADDVVAAVRFAREVDLPVSVRGGGHAVSGHAVREGGAMIDLSPMKAIRVDPAARTARAAAGLLWGEFDRVAQEFGLGTTHGIMSDTGVAGQTLGGGHGHLMRAHGLAVDNLLAVDLVTADGKLIRVDAEREPELFWGLRGGGGNFGIATALEFRLHPIGPTVLGGPIFWPLTDAPEVLRVVRDLAPEAPDELGVYVSLGTAPPLPFVPAGQVGRPALALVLLWAGDPAAGEETIALLRAIGTPFADLARPTPYLTLQSLFDGAAPHGRHYFSKAHRLRTLSDATIDRLVERTDSATSPFSQIAGWMIGGAASRVDPEATALGPREVGFNVAFAAGWRPTDPEPARHAAWVRAGWEALRPESVGVYPNFISDEGEDGVAAAYGDRLPRLVALKDRYDPVNVFRMNANILPSGRP